MIFLICSFFSISVYHFSHFLFSQKQSTFYGLYVSGFKTTAFIRNVHDLVQFVSGLLQEQCFLVDRFQRIQCFQYIIVVILPVILNRHAVGIDLIIIQYCITYIRNFQIVGKLHV